MSKYSNVIKAPRNANIFDTQMQTITITTNTQGIMGAGLAKQTKIKYPHIFPIYQQACKDRLHTTEKPLLILGQPRILCFATKKDWRNKSQTKWIESGLKWIVENEYKIGSIAIPPLGCGLGGLDYTRDLRPLFIKYLAQLTIPVELYI